MMGATPEAIRRRSRTVETVTGVVVAKTLADWLDWLDWVGWVGWVALIHWRFGSHVLEPAGCRSVVGCWVVVAVGLKGLAFLRIASRRVSKGLKVRRRIKDRERRAPTPAAKRLGTHRTRWWHPDRR